MSVFDYLKNIFFILIFLQITPPLIKNIKTQYENLIKPKTKIAVVSISGQISNAGIYTKQLATYFKDDSIRAILLKIDSPGGTTGSSKALFDDIVALKKQHPKSIISLVENVCASGSYYVACATDHIIAPSMATIGSIGTLLPCTYKLDEFIKQYNIGYEDIHAGKYKQAGNPMLAMTPEQKQLLQSMVDNTYQIFTKDVAERRNLNLKEHTKWGDARIFTGQQALEVGLIDQLGSEQLAIQVLREKTGISKDDEIEWVQQRKPSALENLFTGESYGEDASLLLQLGTILSNNLSVLQGAEKVCALI